MSYVQFVGNSIYARLGRTRCERCLQLFLTELTGVPKMTGSNEDLNGPAPKRCVALKFALSPFVVDNIALQRSHGRVAGDVFELVTRGAQRVTQDICHAFEVIPSRSPTNDYLRN